MRTIEWAARSEGSRDDSDEQPVAGAAGATLEPETESVALARVRRSGARQRAAAHWQRCRETGAYATLQDIGRDLMLGRIPARDLAGRAAVLNKEFRAARRSEAMPAATRGLVDQLQADFQVNPEAPVRIDALRRFLTRECGLEARHEADLLLRDDVDFAAQAETIEVAPPAGRVTEGAQTWCCAIEVLQAPGCGPHGPAVVFVDFVCPPDGEEQVPHLAGDSLADAAPAPRLRLHGTVFDGRSTSESLYFVPCLAAVDGLEDLVAFKRNVLTTRRASDRLERILATLERQAALAVHHFTEGYGQAETRHYWSADAPRARFHVSDRARPAAWIGHAPSLPVPRATMLNLACALADFALREVLGIAELIRRKGPALRIA